MSPFFSLLSFLRKGVLFHHDVLVPFCSGSGCGACFPSLFFPQKALELNGVLNSCQKRSLFHHDLLFLLVPALVPVLVSLLLLFFSQEMVFCFLVLARVPVLVSLLLSSFFSQERGFVPS